MRTPPAANIADEASERLAKKRPAEKLNYTHVRHQGPVGTVEGVWAPRGDIVKQKMLRGLESLCPYCAYTGEAEHSDRPIVNAPIGDRDRSGATLAGRSAVELALLSP